MPHRARWSALAIALVGGLMLSRTASAKVIAVWLFNENKGDTVKEATGAHKDDGKFVGGVKWESTGKFGSAVTFDGATGHIEIPDPKNYLTPKKISLMAWVKLGNVGGTKSILEQYDWAGNFGTHAFRMVNSQVQLWVIWGAAGQNTVGGDVKAGEWTHVAGTYDGETIRTWVNGKIVAEAKIAKSDLAPSTKALSIGVRGDTKDIHWMAGSVDEAAIFDQALTEKEMQSIVGSSGGLSTLYLAVSPKSKAAMTWAELKGTRL